MKLVIFSYRHHFNIMQLAYRHAVQAIDNITEVIVVWDDKYGNGDDKLIVAEKILTAIPADRIIFHSDIDYCRDEPLGWLRQQYIKLSLHKIFNDDSWIILDADVILKTPKQFYQDDTLLVYTDLDYYQPYFDFIKYAFDISKLSSPSYMTHFALFERSVLTAVDNWCLEKHNKELIELFKEFYRPLKTTVYAEPMTPPLSEFELYGLFYERILQKPIQCIENSIPNYEPEKFCTMYTQCVDCYFQGIDSDLPDDFWHKHI